MEPKMIVLSFVVALGLIFVIFEQKKTTEKVDRLLTLHEPSAIVEKPKELKSRGNVSVLSDWERRKPRE